MRDSRRWTPWVALAAAALGAGAVSAAIVAQPSSTSVLAVGAAAPPLVFVAGAQASDAVYVKSFALSGNRTSFTAALRGVPQATVVVPELCRIENKLAAAQTVVVKAPNVGSNTVTELKVEFLSGTTVLATLDLRASSPSATFSLPGGDSAKLRMTVGLAEGAGNHNVAANVALSVAGSG